VLDSCRRADPIPGTYALFYIVVVYQNTVFFLRDHSITSEEGMDIWRTPEKQT